MRLVVLMGRHLPRPHALLSFIPPNLPKQAQLGLFADRIFKNKRNSDETGIGDGPSRAQQAWENGARADAAFFQAYMFYAGWSCWDDGVLKWCAEGMTARTSRPSLSRSLVPSTFTKQILIWDLNTGPPSLPLYPPASTAARTARIARQDSRQDFLHPTFPPHASSVRLA